MSQRHTVPPIPYDAIYGGEMSERLRALEDALGEEDYHTLVVALRVAVGGDEMDRLTNKIAAWNRRAEPEVLGEGWARKSEFPTAGEYQRLPAIYHGPPDPRWTPGMIPVAIIRRPSDPTSEEGT